MTAADVLAESLMDWGVDTVFGLPGDGINGIMEALRVRQDKVHFIQVRHEESAAFIACGYAKFTGRLGVCLATSGPGGIHLLNGLYDARRRRKKQRTRAAKEPGRATTRAKCSSKENARHEREFSAPRSFGGEAGDASAVIRFGRHPRRSVYEHVAACSDALRNEGILAPNWKIYRHVGMSSGSFLRKLLRELRPRRRNISIDRLEKKRHQFRKKHPSH